MAEPAVRPGALISETERLVKTVDNLNGLLEIKHEYIAELQAERDTLRWLLAEARFYAEGRKGTLEYFADKLGLDLSDVDNPRGLGDALNRALNELRRLRAEAEQLRGDDGGLRAEIDELADSSRTYQGDLVEANARVAELTRERDAAADEISRLRFFLAGSLSLSANQAAPDCLSKDERAAFERAVDEHWAAEDALLDVDAPASDDPEEVSG